MKKRNKPDATLTNVKASKKRDDALLKRVQKLERDYLELRFAIRNLPDVLEWNKQRIADGEDL